MMFFCLLIPSIGHVPASICRKHFRLANDVGVHSRSNQWMARMPVIYRAVTSSINKRGYVLLGVKHSSIAINSEEEENDVISVLR